MKERRKNLARLIQKIYEVDPLTCPKCSGAMMLVIAVLIATAMPYGEAAGQPPPIPAEEQPEVLTRGPVNEAFAQPVNLEDQTGFIAPTAPPPDIEEIPPAERPAGEQFAWVPGYWAWDSDRNGYIWVSGCWRAVPPDMYWVPGYWAQAPAGWQWVAGFWAPVSNTEIEYLPPPPLTIEEPPAPALSQNRIWVPPCWYWSHGQYILRSGYWIAAQPDWVWVPSHYVWTPRGYVFAAGHWDYSLDRRGVLFAPVYFPRHIYERRGYSYPLSITINIDYLLFGLFSRPQYSHYYFGDYYDSSYISIGIFPWFEFEQRRTWYDPIYAHARWRHYHDQPQWDRDQRREYERRRSDRELRPPRTYHEMERRVSRMPESRRRDYVIAAPMIKVAASKTSPFKFERNKPEIRQQLSKHSDEVHKFVEERRHWESQDAGHGDGRPAMERERMKSAPVEQRGRGVAPESGRKDLTTSPQQKRPMKVSPGATKQKKEEKAEVRTPPEKRKEVEMRPSERMKSAPAEHTGLVATPENGRKGKDSTISPQQQKPLKVSPREIEQKQADRVKVLTPPVVDRQSGVSHQKGLPTRPAEEMNTPVKHKGSEKKPSKQMKAAPAERKRQGAAPGKNQKDSTTSPKQQKSKKVSPGEPEQNQSDMGEGLNPPEVDRNNKGGGKGGGSH